MFFVPIWIGNVLLLITCILSAVQHLRRKSHNPVKNIQFGMIAFALLTILANTIYGHTNPWVSLIFFLIAVGCLGLMIRQQRMLPPPRTFE